MVDGLRRPPTYLLILYQANRLRARPNRAFSPIICSIDARIPGSQAFRGDSTETGDGEQRSRRLKACSERTDAIEPTYNEVTHRSRPTIFFPSSSFLPAIGVHRYFLPRRPRCRWWKSWKPEFPANDRKLSYQPRDLSRRLSRRGGRFVQSSFPRKGEFSIGSRCFRRVLFVDEVLIFRSLTTRNTIENRGGLKLDFKV